MNNNKLNLPNVEDIDNEPNPLILAHYTHYLGADWYLIAEDKRTGLIFGVGDITHTELGFFDLEEVKRTGAVRDEKWEVTGLYDLFPQWKH